MGKLIEHMLDIASNKSLTYICMYKIELVNKQSTKILYCVVATDKPLDRLQQILASFYYQRGYLPRAKIVRMEQTSDVNVLEHIKYELIDYKYYFKSIAFDSSNDIYELTNEQLAIYDKYLPNTTNVRLETLLPQWAYLEKELDELKANSLDINEDYIAIRS